jgi:hypothetical protein
MIWIEDLAIANRAAWIFGHDAEQLCRALRGRIMDHLLDVGASKIIYLDPRAAVLGSLGAVPPLSDRHRVVATATPEFSADCGCGPTILAIAADGEGREPAATWRLRTLAPASLSDACLLLDPGYNATCSTIEDMSLRFSSDGDIRVKGDPLRLFNFVGSDKIPLEVFDIEENVGLFELIRWYHGQLSKNSTSQISTDYWGFSAYEDGTPIRPEHRRRFCEQAEFALRYPNPFAAGPSWYEQECASNS